MRDEAAVAQARSWSAPALSGRPTAATRSVGRGRARPLGGGLTLGGLENAGAVLVRALVAADLRDAGVVALRDYGADLVGRELVVAGPRLVTLERVDAAMDGRAVLVLAP